MAARESGCGLITSPSAIGGNDDCGGVPSPARAPATRLIESTPVHNADWRNSLRRIAPLCVSADYGNRSSVSRTGGEDADPDVFELHIALAACVKLEGDFAVEGTRLGIGEVHHLNSIETRTIAVADHLNQVIIPFRHAHDTFVFWGRPDDPTSAVLAVDTAGVVHHRAVNFKLHALRRIDGIRLESSVKEDAAVAVAHTLETKG